MSPDVNADPPEEWPDTVGPEVPPAVMDPDGSILLVVGPASAAAADVAIALADARVARGLPTVLADASVTEPLLHSRLGIENLEGLADLFLFGASMSRVVTRPEGRDFQFIPTGAYVADPVGVLDSRRWDRIADDMRAAGSLLLLFATAGSASAGALSRRIHRAVLIGPESDATRLGAGLDDRCVILGFADPELLVPAGVESLPPLTSAQRGQLSEPPVVRKQPKPRRSPPWLPAAIAGAVILGIGAGWFLYQGYRTSGPPRVAEEPETAPDPEPAGQGEPVETPIPISVAVEAHQDLTSARERVAALRRAEPTIDFYLAPVAVSGGVYYRLLAGPVGDRETGTALLQRLVDAGHKTAFDTWAVRPTEYAFHLGEHDTEDEATAHVEALADAEVPAYVVTVRYSPGQPRYRVYGGAFETAMEAEVMEELLRNADIEPHLVSRTGEPIR